MHTVQRTIGRGAEYYQYLRSDEWSAVKARYWHSKRPKCCYVCRTPWEDGKFDMHHRTYARLGCELLSDIVPVCRPCHQMIHDIEKLQGIDVWLATEAARKIAAKIVKQMKKPKKRKKARANK